MGERTYLNCVGAERYYLQAMRESLDFICIDVGSESSGLAITIVSKRSSLTIPFIDHCERFLGNYVLSPLEQFLKYRGMCLMQYKY